MPALWFWVVLRTHAKSFNRINQWASYQAMETRFHERFFRWSESNNLSQLTIMAVAARRKSSTHRNSTHLSTTSAGNQIADFASPQLISLAVLTAGSSKHRARRADWAKQSSSV
ncbi:hypothetical protein CIHG_09295 [Coccidioides immitis H538.4]|uniref:Uncharacterized protein n=1 Tax=Coccidioides immitis H538.4 TaxID=396776 RepID=A0A0J8S3L6_COCIT|nr:hypothetical protein CIHG_09295 [Coccidioides immitis H538.4]